MAEKTSSTKTRDVPFMILVSVLVVFLLGMTGDLMRIVMAGNAGSTRCVAAYSRCSKIPGAPTTRPGARSSP